MQIYTYPTGDKICYVFVSVPGSTGFGSALGTSGGGLGTSQFGSMTYKPLG